MFKLTSANKEDLERPGGLRMVWDLLPMTIQDVFRLTSAIGERYIWVDSLCIIQDDDTDKSELIPIMDLIYDRAFLTIIAGSSDNADSGLSGVKTVPRKSQLVVETHTGLRLTLQKQLVDLLEHSVYETRGWTYQERCLSRRCLYIFEEQVIFQCRCAVWREDAILEDPDVQNCIDQQTMPSVSRVRPDWDYFEDYSGSLYWYSRRRLTSASDILNATEGISRVILRRMSEHGDTKVEGVFGLPSCAFDWALLWTPNSVARGRSVAWPSWSWCGWVGCMVSAYNSFTWSELKGWLQDHNWIHWTIFTTDGSICKVINIHLPRRHGKRFCSYETAPCQLPTPQQVLSREQVYRAEYPGYHLKYPEVPGYGQILPLLQFSSLITHFYLQKVDNFTKRADDDTDRCYRITTERESFGAIWVNPAWPHQPGVVYEFIVLSDARLRDIHERVRPSTYSENEWDAYNVMLVEHVCKQQLRSRVAVGVMAQSALEKASEPGSAWEEIWLR